MFSIPGGARAAFALPALAGCAWGVPPGGQGGMRDIQADEIRGAAEDNLLDLIGRVRPSWLYFHDLRDPSDPEETAGPLVMINDVPTRPLFTLRYISPEAVTEIRYLTASYAMHRYRVHAPAGVILVVTPTGVGPPPGALPDTGRVSMTPGKERGHGLTA